MKKELKTFLLTATPELRTLLRFALILSWASLGAGCSSTSCLVVEPLGATAPWIGPGERAITESCLVERFMTEGGYHYIVWTNERGQRFDSRRVTARAEAYLEQVGSKRIHTRGELPPPPFGVFVKDRGMAGRVPLVEPAWVIVSINPTVLVKTSGRVQYNQSRGEGAEVYSTTGWEGVPQVYILLPRGFGFGTRLPYSEDAEWFSPDLKVGPQPLTEVQVGPNEFRIPVPWGELVLRREGNELIVSAENPK